jgi:general stress protein YciG
MQDTSFSPTTAAESTPSSATTSERRLRGFAAMSPEKKREIASMGGRAAHACGRAHQFSSEEARAAGKKRHQRNPDRPTN